MADAEPPDTNSPPTQANSPTWVKVVGVCFLGLAVLFFMALIIASLFDLTVPGGSRFLVCIVLALCAGIGSGFLGGSATASGQISTPKLLRDPISFGVTGGIAVLIIVLALCHMLYGEGQAATQRPIITNIATSDGEGARVNVSVSFKLESLPPQHKLFVEIADDAEFKHMVRPRFPIDNFTTGQAILSIPKSPPAKRWARLAIDNPEGKVVTKSDPWEFDISP